MSRLGTARYLRRQRDPPRAGTRGSRLTGSGRDHAGRPSRERDRRLGPFPAISSASRRTSVAPPRLDRREEIARDRGQAPELGHTAGTATGRTDRAHRTVGPATGRGDRLTVDTDHRRPLGTLGLWQRLPFLFIDIVFVMSSGPHCGRTDRRSAPDGRFRGEPNGRSGGRPSAAGAP